MSNCPEGNSCSPITGRDVVVIDPPVGILTYEMLAGHPPFHDPNTFGVYRQILECKPHFPPFFEKNAKAGGLLRRSTRPTVNLLRVSV